MRVAWAAPAVLLLGGAAVASSPERADRAAFYDLVDRYQMFVVPHCDVATIEAYRAESAARDAAFVRSLQGTKLAGVYARAVADRAKHDRNTIYDCERAPVSVPASSPVVSRTLTQRRRAERAAARRVMAEAKRDREEHFAEGDRLFAEMTALRDRAIAAQRN